MRGSVITSNNSCDSIFELIEQLLSFDNIFAKITETTRKVDNLAAKVDCFLFQVADFQNL